MARSGPILDITLLRLRAAQTRCWMLDASVSDILLPLKVCFYIRCAVILLREKVVDRVFRTLLEKQGDHNGTKDRDRIVIYCDDNRVRIGL